MEVITYSLRNGQKRSDQYYVDIAAFTDEVLSEADGRIRSLVEAFQSYVQETDCEMLRTYPEYTFEFLTLGILWRVYGGSALALPRASGWALAYLVRLRQRGSRWKSGVDLLRGVLGRIFLPSNGRRPPETRVPTVPQLDRLLDWLSASDTFSQEVKRLGIWRDFLAHQLPEKAAEYLAIAITFAAWFEDHSESALRSYTPHVDRFLSETHPQYRWREDNIFCGRRRVEYHLNMVGTEILNRAFRETFLNTQRKVVLAPPCMRAQPNGLCKASSTPFGDRCASCTPGCRVHQLTKLGEKKGFEVFIIPHELSVFSSGAVEPMDGDKVGVVGISCVLTNASGGWETKALGIPAQGVLLDYCGCPWHWHKQGLSTDINFGQLLDVLELNKDHAISSSQRRRPTRSQ